MTSWADNYAHIFQESGNSHESYSQCHIDSGLGRLSTLKVATMSHICRVCSKTFRASSLLDIHMRIHVGAKPFACPTCGHRATQKGNLKLHMKKHHGTDLPPHIDLVPDSGIWGHPLENAVALIPAAENEDDASARKKYATQSVSSLLDEEIVELIRKCQNDIGQGMVGRITESLEDFVHIAKTQVSRQRIGVVVTNGSLASIPVDTDTKLSRTIASASPSYRGTNIRIPHVKQLEKSMGVGKIFAQTFPSSFRPVSSSTVMSNSTTSCDRHKPATLRLLQECTDDLPVEHVDKQHRNAQCSEHETDSTWRECPLDDAGKCELLNYLGLKPVCVVNREQELRRLKLVAGLSTPCGSKQCKWIEQYCAAKGLYSTQHLQGRNHPPESTKTSAEVKISSEENYRDNVMKRASTSIMQGMKRLTPESTKQNCEYGVVIRGRRCDVVRITQEQPDVRYLSDGTGDKQMKMLPLPCENSSMRTLAKIGQLALRRRESSSREILQSGGVKLEVTDSTLESQTNIPSLNATPLSRIDPKNEYDKDTDVYTGSRTGQLFQNRLCAPPKTQNESPLQNYRQASKGCDTNHTKKADHFHSKRKNPSFDFGFDKQVRKESHLSPAKCPICGRISPSSGYLKIHLRSHKDSMKHICSICGRGFKEYWYLNTHMKTHERGMNLHKFSSKSTTKHTGLWERITNGVRNSRSAEVGYAVDLSPRDYHEKDPTLISNAFVSFQQMDAQSAPRPVTVTTAVARTNVSETQLNLTRPGLSVLNKYLRARVGTKRRKSSRPLKVTCSDDSETPLSREIKYVRSSLPTDATPSGQGAIADLLSDDALSANGRSAESPDNDLPLDLSKSRKKLL